MKKYNDTLDLYVKKDKVNEIIKGYEAFGWSLVSKTPNDRYEDLIDLEFQRPHDIENKDELQLTQVYFEDRLEQTGKLQKTKHAKSTSFGLIVGPFVVFLFVLSILWLARFKTIISIILSSLMIVVGIAFLVLEIIVLSKLYKKETADYQKKISTIEKEINDLCTYAKNLIGGSNEQE